MAPQDTLMIRSALLVTLALIALGFVQNSAYAHGGVVEEEDLCVIKVNYLRGHFKIYQPRIDGHREYCEDLPNATETVFVMEYLHDSLGDAAIDFRIVRDVTGKGRFARWEDVAAIEDLSAATVFYRAPTVDPDVLTVIHDFKEEGDYIGVVTANIDNGEQIHRAVFPFEVGFTGLGYWPLIILILAAIQVQYFIMSGRFRRWREKRRTIAAALSTVLLLLVICSPPVRAEQSEWISERGIFAVSFESSLDPIVINQMHSWVLQITAEGDPVLDAELVIIGGMPAHDHGLATSPRVTEELGEGRYRLDGLRFHMHGDWEILIEIEADGTTDFVTVILTL
jgi:hypothetical protein